MHKEERGWLVHSNELRRHVFTVYMQIIEP